MDDDQWLTQQFEAHRPRLRGVEINILADPERVRRVAASVLNA